MFELDQASALAQLHRWGGQALPLNASCWVRDDTEGRELLFVRLRGAVAAVESACRSMTCALPGTRLDKAQAAADWQTCRDHRLPFFTPPPASALALWCLSLPPTAPVLALPWPQLVEWHGGLRWLWAPAQARAQLRQAAARVGGSATLFRAQAPLAAEMARFHPLTPPLDRIHQRLKAEFDPAGILNRGRLYPGF